MRPGFYIRLVVGLAMIAIGVWFAVYAITVGIVGKQEAVILITAIAVGLTQAGSQVLVQNTTSGKDRVVMEAPEGYKIRIQAEVTE